MSHTLRYRLLAILAVSLLALVATRVGAGPESLLKSQSVELLEAVKPGTYTQRTVRIEYMSDATATVCVRGPERPKNSTRATCYYRMHKSTEVVVLDMPILGEIRT